MQSVPNRQAAPDLGGNPSIILARCSPPVVTQCIQCPMKMRDVRGQMGSSPG